MKNRRNIIESELPPQNPLDIWMKDGKLYRSTNKGWVLIEDQMEFTNSELMSKSTATSGTIGVNKETGKASIYNDVTKEWNSLGGGMTETTWQELKDKRDNGQLIPGSLYRITDYNCTTTQENTQSAGHQFDIVLLALSEDKLAEEGWAMMNESNIYDVTFADGVTKKCYLYEVDRGYNIIDVSTLLGCIDDRIEINETNKTAILTEVDSTNLTSIDLTYNYFQNSNLSAWKVWYCLDNDTDRFVWADNNVIGDIENIVVYYPERTVLGGTVPAHDAVYTLTNETQIVNGVTYFKLTILEKVHISDMVELLVDTKNINTETTLYGFEPRSGTAEASPKNISIKSINYNTPPTEEGRGVIYRLIDEWNNDVPYDFKNIMCTLTLDDGGQYDKEGNITYVYTFDVFDIDSNSHKDMSVTIDANTNKVLVQNVQWKQNMDNENEDNVPLLSLNIFYKWNFGNFINLDLNTSFDNIFLAPINNVTAGQLWDCVFEDMTSCTFGYGCNSLTLRGAAYDLNYGNSGVELATKDDLN